MEKFKILEELTSSKEEYDLLYNTDHIFILKGKTPDDNDIFDAVALIDHYEWSSKLRGDHEGPYKIANAKNNQQWFHGYIYGVTSDNLINFEKSALIVTLGTGYTFEKLDIYQTKKELVENHFNSLFEEV